MDNSITSDVDTQQVLPDVQAATSEQYHIVATDQLVLGRPLSNHIYDESGLLLLAEGSLLTEVFKQKLIERNIQFVKAHQNDVHHQVFRLDSQHEQLELAAETYQRSVNDRLEKVLRDQLTIISNDGPAFRDSVVAHGKKALDQATRKKQLRQQQECNQVLCNNMQNMLEGKNVSSWEIFRIITMSIQQMQEDTGCFTALGMLLSRDRSLSMHCQRMSNLAMGIGMELGLNKENIQRIGMTGLLHDWGMLMIPKEIRDPAHPPTQIQQMELEKHCRYTQDILEKIPQLPTIVPILSYQVHERLDGTGYPRRKSAKGIHLFARILHIAHEYCSLTSPTLYRPAYAPHAVMKYLLRDEYNSCRDPLVMRGLLRHLSLYPIGSHVKLSDQSEARVVRTNGDQYLRPIVELINRSGSQPDDAPQLVDLKDSEISIQHVIDTPGRVEEYTMPGRVDQAHSSQGSSHLMGVNGKGYKRTVYLKKRRPAISSSRSNLLRG